MSDAACFEQLRDLRWPEGVRCPECGSSSTIKRGKDDTHPDRQRYACKECSKRFDDLTGTVFEGHHQPLKTWLVCLYLMGLNLSNHQISAELGLNKDDVQAMTETLRKGIDQKKTNEF